MLGRRRHHNQSADDPAPLWRFLQAQQIPLQRQINRVSERWRSGRLGRGNERRSHAPPQPGANPWTNLTRNQQSASGLGGGGLHALNE